MPIFESPSLKINNRKIEVREVKCLSLLHKMNFGARSSTEYTINLYKGCTHDCPYCYAPSLVHDERQWGSYVDVKINAPMVLEKELKKSEKHVVFISSASDPYQVIEAKYKVTRRCLEVLKDRNFPVLILTRSPLVLRDLDLITKLNWVRVGFSISNLSNQYYEPNVPKLEVRLKALQKLSEAGIKTWVSLAPIVPGIAGQMDFEWLFSRLKQAAVSAVSLGVLRFIGYEASKVMFEERTGVSSREALANSSEVYTKIKEAAHRAGLDTSCSSLEWLSEESPARTEENYERMEAFL